MDFYIRLYEGFFGREPSFESRILTLPCVGTNMGENTFVCDDYDKEFPVSEEADDGLCTFCWLVTGA